jgi:hypothetical protein
MYFNQIQWRCMGLIYLAQERDKWLALVNTVMNIWIHKAVKISWPAAELLASNFSGFGGLVVSMLASGTQDHGFELGRSGRIFRAKKSTACLPSEGKICGMLKNPAIYVEVGITGHIDRPFFAQFHHSLTGVSHVAWCGAPLERIGGTKGGAQRARTLKA